MDAALPEEEQPADQQAFVVGQQQACQTRSEQGTPAAQVVGVRAQRDAQDLGTLAHEDHELLEPLAGHVVLHPGPVALGGAHALARRLGEAREEGLLVDARWEVETHHVDGGLEAFADVEAGRVHGRLLGGVGRALRVQEEVAGPPESCPVGQGGGPRGRRPPILVEMGRAATHDGLHAGQPGRPAQGRQRHVAVVEGQEAWLVAKAGAVGRPGRRLHDMATRDPDGPLVPGLRGLGLVTHDDVPPLAGAARRATAISRRRYLHLDSPHPERSAERSSPTVRGSSGRRMTRL